MIKSREKNINRRGDIMNKNKSRLITFCGLCVAINIVLGIATSALKLPFYLDTLGTVITAALVGPIPGAIVGALTNIITGFMYSIRDIPFLLVNVAVALIVGFVAKKFEFNYKNSIITGLVLAVVCPLIGTPIGIALYGGLTGTASDVFVLWLKASGQGIFAASFIPKIGNNLLDKIGTCMMAVLLIKYLPMSMKSSLKNYEKIS